MYVIGYEHLVINDLLSWTAEGICLKNCVAKVIVAVNYKKKKKSFTIFLVRIFTLISN